MALEFVDAPMLFGIIGALAGLTGIAGFASKRLRSL
jgi:hypothetical protein